MTKKYLAGVLAAVTIFSFAGGRLFTASANAATAEELQAQINALLAQIAALQGGSSASCYSFTTDLTLGSTGEAVRALQVYLNKKGFTVAASGAGSVGMESTYFGGLTRAALARYQASTGISPAAGYFGPITRAKVNADCTPGGGGDTGGDTGGTTLNGGEADLNSFDLRAEEGTGNEGQRNVEVATAKFDVDDGDVRVERLQLDVTAASSGLNTQPWKYFKAVSVWNGSTKLASMSVNSRDDWSKQSGNTYRLNVNNLKYVVREGNKAEMTIAFDIADTIDSNNQAQDFNIVVPSQGIRATDGAGIQQYIGDDGDSVNFGFDSADNGDLSVQESDDDPTASILVAKTSGTSDTYTVFAFDIDNDSDDSDSRINEITINGTSSLGNLNSVLRSAKLTLDGTTYDGDIATNTISFDDMDAMVDADDTITAVLKVTLVRNASGTIVFDVDGGDIDAEGADTGDSTTVTGSAQSDTHKISTTGIVVTMNGTTAVTQTPGSDSSSTYGTYTLNFKVKALENTIYIPATASSTVGASTTVGVYYVFGPGSPSVTTESPVLTSTADLSGGFYRVSSGQTKDFTLTVTLDPSAAGTFYVRLAAINFNTIASTTGMSAYTAPSDNADFRTAAIYIAN